MKTGRSRSRELLWAKGSYTVEACVWIPLTMGILAVSLRIGIALHEEIREASEGVDQETMWEVKDFYNYQDIEGLIDDQS